MSLAIDGLVSGLNTTSLIDSLMKIEAAPQTLLKNRATSTTTLVSALQTLNSTVASLATTATDTAKPAATALYSARSSASSVAATASSSASAGSIALTVGSVARAQVSVSAAMTTWPDAPPTLTIVASDGTKTEITASSTSIADVADAINAADVGVSAVRVAAGTDVGGNPQYRLQLSSTTTGADGAFQIYRGTAAQVTANTATDLLAASGAATVTAASDASVTLWAGTPAEQTITSATNTFTDLLPGVSITVSAVESSPVTLTVARDSAGVSAVASKLATSIQSVLDYIATRSAVSTSTSSSGAVTTSGGAFTGNSTVRELETALRSATAAPIDGRSPSELGISISKDGVVSFDSAKFSAAYAADPDGTAAKLATLSSNVAEVATAASDKFTGSLTNLIKGQQSSLRTITDQITQWDDRLATRRSTLERVYAALETQMSALQAQSNWLSGQLAQLSTGSSTS